MSKNSVVEALRTLATSDKSRSETARLRDVFDEVEGALKAGVSRAAILETLHEQGFTMTPKSFESALYRLRRKKGGLHNPTLAGPSDPVRAPAAPKSPEPLTEEAPQPPAAVSTGGKSRTEQVLEAPTKKFSLKQLQKDSK